MLYIYIATQITKVFNKYISLWTLKKQKTVVTVT